MIVENLYNQKVDQTFIRLANKKEKAGGISRSRGYNTIPEMKGYEVVYKPCGENGAGYYYQKILT